MNRTFRYRIYPTAKQQTALAEMLHDHCALYNAALQERRDAYKHSSKTRIKFAGQSKQLPEIRAIDPDGQGRWSASSQQQTLRRLDKAFAAFFRRIKGGQTPGYPRFRSVRRFDTVAFTHGDGGAFLPDTAKVRVHGVGHVKVKYHRPVRGTVKQFSITREGSRWFVNVSAVDVPAQVRPLTGAAIGIDRGVTHLIADSDGGLTGNPRHVRSAEDKLAAAQQGLARKKRGSNRRRKAVARVARLHRHVANARRDHLHKESRRLVDTYDVIVLEDLKVANMARRPKPLQDNAPNGAAAKAGLNKSILDAGWSTLADMIRYKAESAGTEVVFVPAANTSRTCHACGHVAAGNRDGIAFTCLTCGHQAHADVNAARNILRLGLSRHAALAA